METSITILYSILHLLVDGICAFAMFDRFLPSGNLPVSFLLYNFCAFALQMPFGATLDIIQKKKKYSNIALVPCLTVVIGVLFTILGTLTHPAILGIGNALFHIGGGVGTIQADHANHWRGKGLGIFVAPGALGLYLGTLAAKNEILQYWLLIASIIMILCCILAIFKCKKATTIEEYISIHQKSDIATKQQNYSYRKNSILYLALCCLLVVILRSYLGIAVIFPWKTSVLSGFFAVLSIVLGKMAGGFLAARYGILRTSVASLLLAAIAYFFSVTMPFGLAALLLFNMTMPITLYLMVCRFPKMPGFAFGFLTFGLFVGFLPEFFGLTTVANGHLIGCIGSIFSLLLLWAGIYFESHST